MAKPRTLLRIPLWWYCSKFTANQCGNSHKQRAPRIFQLSASAKAVLWGVLSWFCTSVCFGLPVHAAKESVQKNDLSPLTIGVFISGQKGAVSKTVDALRFFSQKRIDDVNQNGGLFGRPIALTFFDDNENAGKTIDNVSIALSDPNLIGMIGLWNSTRGAGVVDQIGLSEVPFISEMSLDSLFKSHENIFSMVSSVSDDTHTFRDFLKGAYKSTLFIGHQADLFTVEFHKTVQKLDKAEKVTLTSTHWIAPGAPVSETFVEKIIASVRAEQPEVLSLAIGSNAGAKVLTALAAAGIDTPVLVTTGSIKRILRNLGETSYDGDFYEVTRAIPNVVNERLAAFRRRAEFTTIAARFSDDDLAYGIIYGDMLSFLLQAARDPSDKQQHNKKLTQVKALRAKIAANLRKYKAGQLVFPGLWRNWSFTPERTASGNKHVHWRPKGSKHIKLWPLQALMTAKGRRLVPVIYTSIDITELRAIDSTNKTFDADFYLSLGSEKPVEIGQFEFTNAARGEANGSPLLRISLVDKRRVFARNDGDPVGHAKLYRVSGRFLFDPKLSAYPFDKQRFSISFQPKSSSQPFLIQPPPATLRDRVFELDGWTLLPGAQGEYVGSSEDIISTVGRYASERKILPLYKFNFTWVAKRNVIDYFLRVVIPLALLLIVAYFSVFIPSEKFDSVIAIQVTALLSTIALYLAIPKLDSETATMSDQIFIFTEAIIGLMVAVSILRVNATAHKLPLVTSGIYMLQVVLFPILAYMMFRYVILAKNGTLGDLIGGSVFAHILAFLPDFSLY